MMVYGSLLLSHLTCARLSVAHQIHDHVDHQEAIQAYKAEINYLLKKKSGT
jgi:hypothetical protein